MRQCYHREQHLHRRFINGKHAATIARSVISRPRRDPCGPRQQGAHVLVREIVSPVDSSGGPSAEAAQLSHSLYDRYDVDVRGPARCPISSMLKGPLPPSRTSGTETATATANFWQRPAAAATVVRTHSCLAGLPPPAALLRRAPPTYPAARKSRLGRSTSRESS